MDWVTVSVGMGIFTANIFLSMGNEIGFIGLGDFGIFV